MKVTHLLLALGVSLSALPQTHGYGPRGAAERVLFWLAYQAETKLLAVVPGYTLTIAPGCAIPPDRCTFSRLIIHIWAPRTDLTGDVRPTTAQLADFDSRIQHAELELHVDIEPPPRDESRTNLGWLMRQVNTHKPRLTNAVDPGRVVSGADGNFDDALRRVTNPIAQLHAENLKDPTNADASRKRIVENGRKMAKHVAFMRSQDFEKFRLWGGREDIKDPERGQFMRKLRSMNPDLADRIRIQTRQVGSELGGTTDVLDIDETVRSYTGTPPKTPEQVRAELLEVHTELMRTENYSQHFSALRAAGDASSTSGCTNPISVHPLPR
ncbi:hypothetical protein TWF696_007987 [Orbilia brochopaga]|uniref:Uncharacterized protein n=1 Tax=Orbilia brochopaga TaxID=3140254 RepID=A0AAV9ULS0_9PEZI